MTMLKSAIASNSIPYIIGSSNAALAERESMIVLFSDSVAQQPPPAIQ